MSLVFRAFAIALAFATAASAAPGVLRVCADPNNMPFSNRHGDGFENKIAELLARDLGETVSYFWSPERRGFVRNTLAAERCDLIMGVPANYERVHATQPYYRSSYVFVSRHDRHLAIRSFDDVRLKDVRIGIQLTGDDYANPPAAQALASRGIIQNVRGFTVYGDYAKADPQRDVVDAVARGAVDVAVVWGPLAGYFARHEPVQLDLSPVTPDTDGPLRFSFAIAAGVRRGDRALHDKVDAILAKRTVEIRRILTAFGVPLV